ncbi:MAG: elongation factor T [Candidatus Peregrinibacteria bacterium Greene0416_19]|nr:MAG: elongation factor T [Candidatus Peregrinibacteria bacterium Greene0416_19]
MPPIPAASVASLRARTGVSILACKQALEESGGDEEKAIEILRKRGIAQAVKKADREQHEGAIFIAQGNKKAALLLLRCETDFVARSDDFIAMGQGLAQTVLEKGRDAAMADLEKTVPELVQKLGENISTGEVREAQAPSVGTYVHSNRKIGVIIGLDKTGEETKAKDVAMHAAAMNPQYTNPEDVPSDTMEKEREIWSEQMKDGKKPPEILEKIIQGKERKFREENALIKQPFVKDSSMSVEKYLGGATVTEYVRVTV